MAYRNPTECINSYANLILKSVELGFNGWIVGKVIAAFVSYGLPARWSIEVVIPPVVPGNRDWSVRLDPGTLIQIE